METRSQSRSKLPSATDAAVVLDATEKAAAAAPKSALAARLEKREAMKRSSMNTNVGDDPESDLSDDDCAAEEVNGGRGGDNGHGESDDDGEELEGEVEDLKEEDMFARFTSEIVSGREFPAGEFDSARPEDDPEYELPPPNRAPFAAGAPEGELSVAAGAFTVEEIAFSSSGSSDSEGEKDEEEEDDPLDPEAVPLPDVPIPGVALGEAAKRFPPFWRTKNRLSNLDAASYKSEEDPTFVPTQAEFDRASEDEDVDENEGEEDGEDAGADAEEADFEISEEEAAALDDLSAAFVDNDLTAVMEDLTIGEGVEKADMAAESAEKICLVEAIEEFDPAGYDEAADPDYDPLSAPTAEVNEAGEMDSGSDDEEEGMEQ